MSLRRGGGGVLGDFSMTQLANRSIEVLISVRWDSSPKMEAQLRNTFRTSGYPDGLGLSPRETHSLPQVATGGLNNYKLGSSNQGDPAIFLGNWRLACTACQIDAMDQNDNTVGKISVHRSTPYYDNIGYADLSDFFYIWLRRSVSCDPCSRTSSPRWPCPRLDELVATPYTAMAARRRAEPVLPRWHDV